MARGGGVESREGGGPPRKEREKETDYRTPVKEKIRRWEVTAGKAGKGTGKIKGNESAKKAGNQPSIEEFLKLKSRKEKEKSQETKINQPDNLMGSPEGRSWQPRKPVEELQN